MFVSIFFPPERNFDWRQGWGATNHNKSLNKHFVLFVFPPERNFDWRQGWGWGWGGPNNWESLTITKKRNSIFCPLDGNFDWRQIWGDILCFFLNKNIFSNSIYYIIYFACICILYVFVYFVVFVYFACFVYFVYQVSTCS